ncbi:MAG: hypothetical protein V1746_06540 [bacterium]
MSLNQPTKEEAGGNGARVEPLVAESVCQQGVEPAGSGVFQEESEESGQSLSEGSSASPVNQAAKGLRMRFQNLTPLRRKTLEFLRERPELDGTCADRLAREALGLTPPPAQGQGMGSLNANRQKTVVPVIAEARRTGVLKNPFTPAPGSFGTTNGRSTMTGDHVLERLKGLSWADRRDALLAVLSAAAQQARK